MTVGMLAHGLSRQTDAAATIGGCGMLICPKCRTTYSSSLIGACYRDGEKLVDHDTFVAAENDPMRKRLVGGKYRIEERIGQGGMGTVYRAVQSGLNRDVAVKILKRELNVDRDTVARFHREANAMSLLNHPNTVRVYDFGQTDDGLLYLVMELLRGELITQRLTREGALDVLEALRFTQQILRSLSEAHTKSLVHRDLKPDNIFVANAEGHQTTVIKVLDFGIAKVVAPDKRVDQFETQAGTVFGTPRYMSPEQAQGGQLDGRSDLYSVGTLLYQMLTGRAPFVDDDAVVVMAKHIREMPDAPRKAAPDRPIPASLEAVVMRALAKEPAARFQEATEFEAALDACVPDVLAAQANPRDTLITLRPERPRPLVWALLAVSVMGFSYFAYRSFLPTSGSARAIASQPLDVATHEPEPAPVVTPKPIITPTPFVEQQVPVPAAEPAPPAHVTLRSKPRGAKVFRDGKKLGVTPLEMLVGPDEEFVRVELRLDGYQPLAAELTAKEGERLLELSRIAPAKPSAKGTSRKRAARTQAPARSEEREQPAKQKRDDSYERFE
jgi:serine/threonine protein kinase